MLADYLHLRIAEQFMVLEQIARNGILDGHDSEQGGIGRQGLKLALEGLAADHIDLRIGHIDARQLMTGRCIGKILSGRPFMVATLLSLYGNT